MPAGMASDIVLRDDGTPGGRTCGKVGLACGWPLMPSYRKTADKTVLITENSAL
jgi:hypothetical protein